MKAWTKYKGWERWWGARADSKGDRGCWAICYSNTAPGTGWRSSLWSGWHVLQDIQPFTETCCAGRLLLLRTQVTVDSQASSAIIDTCLMSQQHIH